MAKRKINTTAAKPVLSAIQKKLIENGIKNLREFGYPDVTADNILTDLIYSAFYKQMLQDNLGKGFDKEINGLLDLLPKN